MSHDLIQKRVVVSVFPTAVEDAPAAGGYVDFNATGEKYILTSPVPIDVYRFGISVATTLTPTAATFTLTLKKRVTIGTTSGGSTIDSLRRAVGQVVAAGKVAYRDVIVPIAETLVPTGAPGLGGQKFNTRSGGGPLHLKPGEEAVLEVTTAAGAASTGLVWIEYSEKGMVLPNTVATTDGANVIQDVT